MSSIDQALDKLQRASQRLSASEQAATPELQLLLDALAGCSAAGGTLSELLEEMPQDPALEVPGAGQGLLLSSKYGPIFKVGRGVGWQPAVGSRSRPFPLPACQAVTTALGGWIMQAGVCAPVTTRKRRCKPPVPV